MGNWVLFWEQKSLADRCEDFGQSQDSIKYGGFLNWVIVHCLLQRDIVTRTQIISCFVIVQLCPSFTFTVLLKNNFCARENSTPLNYYRPSCLAYLGKPTVFNSSRDLYNIFFFYWRYNPLWFCIQQPSSGIQPPRVRGFLITHNDAPQSVGLLWTSDQSVAETST